MEECGREFGWLAGAEIAPAHDLRRCGWRLLVDQGAGLGHAPLLVYRPALTTSNWLGLLGRQGGGLRGRMVLIGIGDPGERGRLLKLGFGDVVSSGVTLDELDVRAGRIAAQADLMPRRRQCGPLLLDLFVRDAFVGSRPLGLHPREFSLLWRLVELAGQPVAKQALVADVWRLGHVPETNSIAVHVSRLRAKLALAGLEDLIETVPGEGYRLAQAAPSTASGPAAKVAAFHGPG